MARTVIKLGSAIVATDEGELRAELLGRICAAVAAARAGGDEVAIVTSGAIARGTRVLGLTTRPTAIEELQAASAVGQGRLYRVYDELLAEHGAVAAQVLLTFSDVSARASYLNARQTLGKLLDWGTVPVINENDTTATDEISFGDNDFLAAQVAILIAADRLILLTNTDGLYSADPRTNPTATLVEHVEDFAALDALEITQTTSAHGSGGMRSKGVAAALAMREGGTSLLPVGVVEVRGSFEQGDAVDVVEGERLIGKGICNYSAVDLRRAAGRHSAAVREVLPRATEEAVHRDYFVLAYPKADA